MSVPPRDPAAGAGAVETTFTSPGRLGLERRILLLLSAIVAAVLIADGVRSIGTRSAELRAGLATRAELLATVQADALASALWDFDDDKALAVFAALALDPDLVHARLYGPDGEVRWQQGGRAPRAEDLAVRRPIVRHAAGRAVPLGELELFVSSERVEAAVARMVGERVLLLVLMLAAVLGTIGAGLRRLAVPLARTAAVVARLARGEHARPVPEQERDDEIGAIARALERLRLAVREAERLRGEEAAASRAELTRIRAAVESSSDPILVLDADGRPVFVNAAASAALAGSLDRLARPGAMLALIIDRQQRRRLVHDLRTTGAFSAEVELALPTGRTPVELRVDRIKGADAGVVGWVVIASDVSERRAAAERIRHLAHHDPLTGLPNRTLFGERLAEAVSHGLERGERVALMLVDLDRFKEVNDALGHPAGDALLCAAASRLRRLAPPGALVARLGGDEFAILLRRAGESSAVAATARRIAAAMAEPFALDGRIVRSGATIGIALTPEHACSPEGLLQHADLALYRAKAEGRGRMRLYDPEIGRALAEARELEADLHEALARDELRLVYQPRVAIASGEVVGAEALIRWHHPRRGLVAPASFVPLAEERGLIVAIGARVLDQAVAQAARWAARGGAPLRVSVNLSPVQFREDDVAALVARVLARHRLPPDRLELEITEGVLLQHTREVVRTLERVRAMGVSVALDDFGTGYSSLSYLRRFRLDRLKLDRSFVCDLETDPSARSVARTVIELGHALAMSVTAEGIETQGQLATLAALGCDEAQGHLLARPGPPEAFEQGRLATPALRAPVALRTRAPACTVSAVPT
ncbi:MAG: EAL domain-containing protein [Geminicoccaceae bacterium]|nr:EAL domain-containing protein [Geminicoccaceae bacterium]